MRKKYQTSAEYFRAGLQNGFAAAIVFCVIVGFVGGGILGVAMIGLACWLTYKGIDRVAMNQFEQSAAHEDTRRKPRSEMWWLAFAIGGGVSMGLAFSFVAIANYF